jgi:hypothetical protein
LNFGKRRACSAQGKRPESTTAPPSVVRMDDDIGAVVDRPQQDRRRHGVVDDERNAVASADRGELFDVADIAGWIADALAENPAAFLVDQRFDRVGLIGGGEANLDALARQDIGEQRVGGAVKLRDRDDIGADVGEVEDGVVQGRLARAHAQRFDAALELGDPPLEHGRGRIADAAIAMTLDFEIEQRGAVVGALELIGHGLIDRHRDRARRRLGLVTAVNSHRVAFHFSRHAALLFWLILISACGCFSVAKRSR